jgi:hypothetical protein
MFSEFLGIFSQQALFEVFLHSGLAFFEPNPILLSPKVQSCA